MNIQDDTVDQLLAGRDPTKDLLGPDGLIRELTKRLVERALQTELTKHLGYGKGEPYALALTRRDGGRWGRQARGGGRQPWIENYVD